MSELRVIMIPGMACDGRVFAAQRAEGLEFEVPVLPTPGRNESLRDYAWRIRDQLRLDGSCIVGGVSFGGMIAYELAQVTKARHVVLVASCTSRQAIPRYYWWLERVSRLLPDFWIDRRVAGSAHIMTQVERLTDEQHRVILEMARDAGVTTLRRIARMIMRWDPSPTCPCPVHHIHGARDRVIPLRCIRPQVVIPDGGHLINLTHAGAVNSFLRRHFHGQQ